MASFRRSDAMGARPEAALIEAFSVLSVLTDFTFVVVEGGHCRDSAWFNQSAG